MTPYEFRALPEDKQKETVEQGEFCLAREDREHTVLLYKVQDFYVEAYYHNFTNRFVHYDPFNSKTRLTLFFGTQLN